MTATAVVQTATAAAAAAAAVYGGAPRHLKIAIPSMLEKASGRLGLAWHEGEMPGPGVEDDYLHAVKR